jgi:hypothetical protein
MVFIVERNIQYVQKVWKHPNENATHNLKKNRTTGQPVF